MAVWQTLRFAVRTAQFDRVSRWNGPAVDGLAHRRLSHLVRFAAAHSPFYREKYRGIDPRNFSLTDLPPTTKQELRENFQATLTDPALRQSDIELFLADSANVGRWFAGKYALSHTSGSQGRPLVIVQDRAALETLFALMAARANPRARPSLAEGLRRLKSPARVAVVAQHRGFYPSAAAFEFMREFTRPLTDVRRFSALDPLLADQLNEFQPNTLVGYASVLEGLALDAEAFRFSSLGQIANSSEQLTDRARRRIETAFGVPVLDHYGTGECLFLSDGCPTDGGAHVNSDWAILEVVDADNRPVPPGQVGSKVLVTNLANRIQPFIRYEVPDRLLMATTPCRCGNRLPRIERIDGRSSEAFWIADRAGNHRVLPGVLFHNAIDQLPGVRQWRAVQHERNQIELQIEFFDRGESSEPGPELLERLRQFGLPPQVQVSVEPVVGLSPDAHTGKFRRLISHVGPPERPAPAEHRV